MKKTFTALFLILASTWVLAGPGHDHGPEDTGVTESNASPRVLMQSDLFEAVGVVKGHTLQLFVDHTSTNAPVENATLDLELNGSKVAVEQQAEGKFNAHLPDSIGEENVTVALTITAGDNMDILAGDLNLAHAHDDESHDTQQDHFSRTLLFSAAFIVLIALVTWFAKRRSNKGVI